MSAKLGKVYDGGFQELLSGGFMLRLMKINARDDSIRELDDDFYELDEKNYRLVGRRTKREYRLGQSVTIQKQS